MLLYQRFEIPENGNWPAGQPVQATDCWSGRSVLAYRSTLASAIRDHQIEDAQRIHAELTEGNRWSADAPEIFTQGRFLWTITQQGVSEDPLIARFREARLLPPLPEAKPAPAVAAAQCPRCQGVTTSAGVLCGPCAGMARANGAAGKGKGGNLLVGFGVLAVAGLVAVGLIWAAWSILSSLNTKPALDAKFWTTESVVAAGSSATLRWNSSGASDVSIDHGVGKVSSEGVTTVSPDMSTTYTLTAIGGGRQITRQITVDVLLGTRKPAPGQPAPGQDSPGQDSPGQDSSGQGSPGQDSPGQDSPGQDSPAPGTQPRAPEQAPQTPNTTIGRTPQGVSAPSAESSPAPAPMPAPKPAGPPTSGELRCAQPVLPHGQVTFPNLPKGMLHFDVPNRREWLLLIHTQPDGGQTLVMVSLSAETQDTCSVRWTLTH